TLFDENCIVDLSNIGSQETRALIMGLLIIRLKEYRYAVAREANSQTKHVTVLEEAHNILKRCPESGQSSILTASVEMLTASIAEMRTYGEGFLIVDQSPSAVDATAIKNTAIKIVLRLPEEQDCKEIGNALALTEDQTRELSRLDIGVAAVFHPGWNETVLAKSDIFNPVNSKGEKKYPEKSVLAVNHVELIQMRGLAVSMLFNALKEHKLNPDFKDELVDLMSEKCLKDCKSLSDGKLDELIEIISGFFNTLSDSSPARARQLLFSFAIDFLQIKDLFGILPLRSNEPKEKMFVGWHNQFQKALAYYIQLPGAKGPALDRELKEISSGIIEAYSLMAEKKNHKEFMECWTYLTRQGCFK
ncbi:MAG: hypothetical protein LBC41_00745, partial [Clostridiales bacterium]|nr:hypothetical protein [Clostridiales bacterium]